MVTAHDAYGPRPVLRRINPRRDCHYRRQPHQLEDRFYCHLAFGTGGLRGLISAGTNRINRYVVRHGTQGLADYMNAATSDPKSVIIAYDCRRYSKEFARQAALTLNANGIPAYLWNDLRPTPMLSFAVRCLEVTVGSVNTASHNLKEYNGYKVYWSDDSQVPPERAAAILERIQNITDITIIHPMPQDEAKTKGLLRKVASWVDRAYYDQVLSLITSDPAQRRQTKILYTPVHGTGNIPLRTVLAEAGFQTSVGQGAGTSGLRILHRQIA